jgi:hypothetical protein
VGIVGRDEGVGIKRGGWGDGDEKASMRGVNEERVRRVGDEEREWGPEKMGWGREGRVEVAGMKVGNEGTGMRGCG